MIVSVLMWFWLLEYIRRKTMNWHSWESRGRKLHCNLRENLNNFLIKYWVWAKSQVKPKGSKSLGQMDFSGDCCCRCLNVWVGKLQSSSKKSQFQHQHLFWPRVNNISEVLNLEIKLFYWMNRQWKKKLCTHCLPIWA